LRRIANGDYATISKFQIISYADQIYDYDKSIEIYEYKYVFGLIL